MAKGFPDFSIRLASCFPRTETVQLLRVFLPFAAGYFLSYVFRVVNAVIAPDLVADTGVGPSALGMLTAVYFISFAAFQLPLGILLDRFGPRKVEALLLLFAGLGASLFARAETLAGLVMGRALIGFGVSSCLMAAFKAYTLWLPPQRWPLVNGFQMAAGGLGALVATSPVETALRYTGWRGLFTGLGILSLLIAVAVFLIVPEKKTGIRTESLGSLLQGIIEVFTSRKFWRLAPLTTMSQGTFLAIQGLWTGPWLTHVGKLERTAVADLLFRIAVAMVTGFIGLGGLAGWLGKKGVPAATTAVVGMALFMVVQLLLIAGPVGWASPLWLGFGFLGTASILSYSALSQSFPAQLSGRVITATNLLVFIAAFAGQWAIGVIIGVCSDGRHGIFPAIGFQTGFGLMLALQCAGLLWYMLVRR